MFPNQEGSNNMGPADCFKKWFSLLLVFTWLSFKFYKHLLNTYQVPGPTVGPEETTKIKKMLSCLHACREDEQINNQALYLVEKVNG